MIRAKFSEIYEFPLNTLIISEVVSHKEVGWLVLFSNSQLIYSKLFLLGRSVCTLIMGIFLSCWSEPTDVIVDSQFIRNVDSSNQCDIQFPAKSASSTDLSEV